LVCTADSCADGCVAGKELVIFSPDQILPTYIIHYTTGSGGGRGFGGFY
jgi:hypothetical protein